jgi:hypothetical protein
MRLLTYLMYLMLAFAAVMYGVATFREEAEFADSQIVALKHQALRR